MIYLGSDHGGYYLKEKLKKLFQEYGYEYEDLGNIIYDKDDDYPDFAFKVAEKVSSIDNNEKKWQERPKGILLCRSAGGMIIAANKVKNIRAVAVFDEKSVKHARQHNDANIIALPGDWLDEKKAIELVKIFLSTEFSREERHIRRLNKIKKYEK